MAASHGSPLQPWTPGSQAHVRSIDDVHAICSFRDPREDLDRSLQYSPGFGPRAGGLPKHAPGSGPVPDIFDMALRQREDLSATAARVYEEQLRERRTLKAENERLHRDLDVLTIRARIAENGRDDALGSLARAERRAEELHKQGVGLQRELREAAAAAQQRDEVARVQENRIRVLSEHLARERRAGADARSALAQAQERSSEARAEARESARKLQDSQERERVLRGEVESERRGRSMLEERISCMRGQLEEYKEAVESLSRALTKKQEEARTLSASLRTREEQAAALGRVTEERDRLRDLLREQEAEAGALRERLGEAARSLDRARAELEVSSGLLRSRLRELEDARRALSVAEERARGLERQHGAAAREVLQLSGELVRAERERDQAVVQLGRMQGQEDVLRPCSLLELQALVALSEQAAPKLREAMVQAALREKDAETAEATRCSVCWHSRKDTALNCGHVFCEPCAGRVDTCPVCRATICARTRVFM